MGWKKSKQTSNMIFETTINCFLASNLLAQFSRQIVIQILGMASPKVCGNLAIRPLYQFAVCGKFQHYLSILFERASIWFLKYLPPR
jgi:hypothetical protein